MRSIKAAAAIVATNAPIVATVINLLETFADSRLLSDMMNFNLLVRLAAEAHDTPAILWLSENLETFRIADA